MNKGDYVSNIKAPQYGLGQVVSRDGNYLTVYFESLDEEKEFSIVTNALKLENKPNNNQVTQYTTSYAKKMNNTEANKLLNDRVKRDAENASLVPISAKRKLHERGVHVESGDFVSGLTDAILDRQRGINAEVMSLRMVMQHPFHAMMEVVTVTSFGGTKTQLVYTNEHINSNLAGLNVPVLTWTHPIVQLGLSSDLNEENDIRAKGYTLKSITPIARAKYSRIFPEVAGLYEPGGPVRAELSQKPKTGLKAVKLDMTKEQVKAFLSKMNGMMLVSGAPGSGKTTVAMQRVRFLYDQQDIRQEELKNVKYAPELTKIFLANQNLIDYSKEMLEKELHISSSVIELVGDFVHEYLDDIWKYKNRARIRKRDLLFHELRGRQAFFGLCNVVQLKDCWESYEYQISERLYLVSESSWASGRDQNLAKKINTLVKQIQIFSKNKVTNNPVASRFKLDSLYDIVKDSYEELRRLHRENGDLEGFDIQFQQWLYWVYDPLDGIESYFVEEAYAGKFRIKEGIGAKIDENKILEDIKTDWQKRTYGREEEPWLAFLLRFVLPTEVDQKLRFREIANPLEVTFRSTGEQWTHIMVDEAQDLCVAEAALLGSFVHQDGAFTVAADYHQVVSPVWGMENSHAFNVGSSLKGEEQLFPFAKNMRQSKQIGLFLKEFYHNAFGELAPFGANDSNELKNGSPLLMLGSSSEFPVKIKQRLAVMRKNPDIKTIALLQINEDEKAMHQLRSNLEKQGIDLAPVWAPSDINSRLITTSVERIKGLEYDACFIIGMDDIDNATLKYSKNRAYVALSRPALQLTILCEEMPKYLQKIDNDYMTVIDI